MTWKINKGKPEATYMHVYLDVKVSKIFTVCVEKFSTLVQHFMLPCKRLFEGEFPAHVHNRDSCVQICTPICELNMQ